ncbi:gp629 [Bacillus phage G]|uniref:Gp629 n=1 Tax=Bacillus phage G TaxID=2884420 RepID=G3MB09_9CAUD|nr:gp629 [Bacillus phage G]AEO93874.1 gp629 [Bacillus phage G]
MMKMQDKILNHIDKIASDNSFEATISYSASNVGKVFIIDDYFKSVLIISFNFQTQYCTITSTDCAEVAKPNCSNSYLEYKNSDELNRLFDNIGQYLHKVYWSSNME